jgi:glycosyltransferase involved in cell wall biosynthesis
LTMGSRETVSPARGTTKLAIVVSHPIQHFTPMYRVLAEQGSIELQVFFACDWGVKEYLDPGFGELVEWDIPMLEGYGHEFLPIRRRPRRLDFFSVDNPGVGNHLNRFRPDVVMVHGWAYATNWRVRAWCERRGVPLLLFTDSQFVPEVRTARGASLRRRVKGQAKRYFYHQVDGAFCVGDSNRAYHRHFGLPDERLFRGVYPVDAKRLLQEAGNHPETRSKLRGEIGIPDDAFVGLFVGKFVERKRAEDLVLATAQLAGSSGSPTIWSLIVGAGPLWAGIEALVESVDARNCVLTGFVNQTQLPKYYAAADALVVPSREDPHPLVVTEAAVFGLPVVVSDRVGCIGPGDTARPGANAIIFPCGDVNSLAAALRRLAADPATYETMSQMSRAVAQTQDAESAADLLADACSALARIGKRS